MTYIILSNLSRKLKFANHTRTLILHQVSRKKLESASTKETLPIQDSQGRHCIQIGELPKLRKGNFLDCNNFIWT